MSHILKQYGLKGLPTVAYPPNMEKKVLCLHAKDEASFLVVLGVALV